MIALDTNVLVRFIVEDAEALEQSTAARELVLASAAAGDHIFLPDVVLCEFVWVLRRVYEVDRSEVAATLEELLTTEHLVFESPRAVVKAVNEYASGPADFADYLLRNVALNSGCDLVYTFDRKFARSDRVELLS